MTKDNLPVKMTLGDRAYDILGFLRDVETSVKGDVMANRAVEANANLGQKECEHLLVHQGDIPVALQGKVAFVFMKWRHPDDSEYVAYVCWHGGRWVQGWDWLVSGWDGHYRVLRRK